MRLCVRSDSFCADPSRSWSSSSQCPWLGCDGPKSGTQGGKAADQVLIGHYGSLTGSEATFGQSTDNGIKLAVKEINAAGGLNGKKVELKTYDDKGDTKETGAVVTRLVTQDKVSAVLGEVASKLSAGGGPDLSNAQSSDDYPFIDQSPRHDRRKHDFASLLYRSFSSLS